MPTSIENLSGGTKPLPTAPTIAARIHSMDQFRGYIVAAMFAVNYGIFHEFSAFAHNNSHASFADLIMPGFIFAAGFSLRLTALRRHPDVGFLRMSAGYLRRSFLLILIVLVMEGFGSLPSWQGFGERPKRHVPSAAGERELDPTAVEEVAATDDDEQSLLPRYFGMNRLYWGLGKFRRTLCEVLGIIALTQIVVLPVILARSRTRILAMAVFGLAHVLMTYWFNWDFFHGRPNVVDELLHLKPRRCYDGGFFGNVSWAVVMLAGSLAYDIVANSPSLVRASARLLGWGTLLMCLGYAASIPSRLYDLDESKEMDIEKQTEVLKATPVLPPFENAQGRAVRDWFPPLPVFQSDDDWKYVKNYWTTGKYVVTLPFVLFSSGFSLAVYAMFVLITDRFGFRIGLLRTLGTNALAAYVIHSFVLGSMEGLSRTPSPYWYQLLHFYLYFAVVYLFVRTLERRKIYIRL